ncbi:TlpA family protein disulfide reductase [Parabacteroides sp. AF18-52]|jgi:hypothetical protein|uniref:TlpA family protein disulfide reductase n=1 Tax=Parabacteroides TaxID=375288 RepID=UPI000FED7A3D|nr:TlpA disulfide reductase family protein [Parabacteroides sp. AF18-52]RHR43197.1 TlpA family protein disulfide reductase [Parabacteroides sp. AF18-52]
MKRLLLPLIPLLCLSCNPSDKEYKDYSKEVIITGKVLNSDFYPQEKDLTLIVPFFRDQETKYVVPIAEDGSFSFRFSPYAKLRNVQISKYADHLFVSPGDSLHVEIDFKNILNPKISGDAEKRNQEINTFAQSGRYYIEDYLIRRDLEPEAFETELQQEYQLRQERRLEFLDTYKPDEEIRQYTDKLLKIDYYRILIDYLSTRSWQNKDISRYNEQEIFAKADSFFEGEIIPSNIFKLTETISSFITCQIYKVKKEKTTFDDFVAYPTGKNIKQYLYAASISQSLVSNDTTLFSSRQKQLDSIVHIPVLNQVLHSAYQNKKDFLKNPRTVSNYMLYGNYSDMPGLKVDMDFMKPVYEIMDKYKGKVIYLDFWTTACSPCLGEMEPLKKLRKEFSPEDVVMVSICAGGPRKTWEDLVKRLDLQQPGIDCLYQTDFADDKSLIKILNRLELKGYPHYLLLNREGIIVDYGTVVRPSDPRTKQKINSLL